MADLKYSEDPQCAEISKEESLVKELSRDLVAAKLAFDSACYSIRRSEEERDKARERILGIREKLNSFIAGFDNDPTRPLAQEVVGGMGLGISKASRY